jgi:hypothetical protein
MQYRGQGKVFCRPGSFRDLRRAFALYILGLLAPARELRIGNAPAVKV